MDRYTKIVFSIVALVIVIEKVTQLAQMGNVKKVTLCTALDDCGVGTRPNPPLIIKYYGDDPYLYRY